MQSALPEHTTRIFYEALISIYCICKVYESHLRLHGSAAVLDFATIKAHLALDDRSPAVLEHGSDLNFVSEASFPSDDVNSAVAVLRLDASIFHGDAFAQDALQFSSERILSFPLFYDYPAADDVLDFVQPHGRLSQQFISNRREALDFAFGH